MEVKSPTLLQGLIINMYSKALILYHLKKFILACSKIKLTNSTLKDNQATYQRARRSLLDCFLASVRKMQNALVALRSSNSQPYTPCSRH